MRLIDGDALYKELNAIRKEEVLLHGRSNNKDCCTLSTALYEIEHAPTIEPERKPGKWIFHERREPQFDISGAKTWSVAYKCSECGFIHTVIEDFGHYKFCPNCGSDNREAGDRE